MSAAGIETGFTGYGLAFLGLGCSAVLALALFLATMRLLPLQREGGRKSSAPPLDSEGGATPAPA